MTTPVIWIILLGLWSSFLCIWTWFFRASKKSTPQQVNLDADTTIKAIEESISISDAVRRKANNYIAKRLSKVYEAEQEAKKALSNFLPSRFSASVRNDLTYFAEGDCFDEKQKKVISDGIESAKKNKSKQGLKLKDSVDVLARLSLVKDDKGKITNEVSAKKVYELFNQSNQGIDLFVNQTSLEICKKKAYIKKIIKEVSSSSGGRVKNNSGIISVNSNKSSITNTVTADANQLVKDSIARQMDSATSPENILEFGAPKRSSQEQVINETKTFALTGGPADITAYHDFYDLQIAFKHIWTEVFDKELARQAESLYGELVAYKNELGVKSDVGVVTSVEQLRQLMNDIRKAYSQMNEEDPLLVEVMKWFPNITPEIWSSLDPTEKKVLIAAVLPLVNTDQVLNSTSKNIDRPKKVAGVKKLSRIEKMLKDLEERLSEKYSFDIFYADPITNKYSMNYGILVDYRQEWKPINYQVGELVSTIPLAPKELKKYSKKRVVRKKRSTKEIENALQIRKEESSDKARVSAEIIRRATNKTNFRQNAEGGVNFAVWNAKASLGIEINSAKQSAQTKKQFRENVLKAAEEYRHDHRLEISTASSDVFEETTSGEISNPNDELSVTYLFYELQRRYEITERIHKLTPVVLIANEMPRPNEIDEDWLLAHDWILKRVILDDSFLLALDYLKESYVGDEISTEVLRENLSTQIEVVEKISQQIQINSSAVEVAQITLNEAIERYAQTQKEESGGLFGSVADFFTGGDDDLSETERIRMEAAKDAFQRAERQKNELRSQLEQDITALHVATDKYANALQEQFNRRTEILRLRAHVKDNILYYMHAIWDQEPPDQRFFRLYNIDVVDIVGEGLKPILKIGKNITIKFEYLPSIQIETKKLIEVADLDNLLGYKGNYMIFPLKKNNPITLFMMQDYINIEETVILEDPDELGNYKSEELIEFAKCVQQNNPNDFDDEFKNKIEQILIKRLTNPYREKDQVVVPTDSLYIEALPGKNPILEDFKLAHRSVDVKKVQAEVRHEELENVRLAARALKGEYEDPDIEKKVVIEGEYGSLNMSTET